MAELAELDGIRLYDQPRRAVPTLLAHRRERGRCGKANRLRGYQGDLNALENPRPGHGTALAS
jgi:hypothetical protein